MERHHPLPNRLRSPDAGKQDGRDHPNAADPQDHGDDMDNAGENQVGHVVFFSARKALLLATIVPRTIRRIN
jgi:hypothetical protein